jgi:hypothetical protein
MKKITRNATKQSEWMEHKNWWSKKDGKWQGAKKRRRRKKDSVKIPELYGHPDLKSVKQIRLFSPKCDGLPEDFPQRWRLKEHSGAVQPGRSGCPGGGRKINDAKINRIDFSFKFFKF